MERLKCLKKTLFLCLSVLFCCLFCLSSPANADSLSISVGLITSADNIGIQGVQGQSCSINNQSGYFQNTSTNDYCAVNRMTWGSYISSLGWGIGNGNYLKISFYGYELRDREAIHSVQNNGFQGYIWVNGTERSLVPVGFSGGMTSESSALFEYIFKYEGPSGTITRLDLAPGVAVAPNELYRMGMIGLYGVAGAGADYSSKFDDLVRQNEAIITKLGNSNVNELTIINALSDLPTESGIKDAIEDARDDEKSEYETQSEQNEDDIDADSSAAQSAATSLLSVVGQFIGVLTSAQPTNCNLDGNLIPHLPLGNLNLCQNDPPAAIVVLGSLLLIAFVVPLAYHTVKRMLALIGSFQS